MATVSTTVQVSEEALSKLRNVSTSTLHTLLFREGLRHQFMVNVRPFNPEAARFAGEAVTLRFIPAREDLETHNSVRESGNKQWEAIESTGPGQVLVVDSREDIRAASAGDVLLTRLMRRGAAAAVTDGAFRDGPKLQKLPFPAYARATNATTRLSWFHAADIDLPIGCAGVAVYPRDIIVGDGEGVIVIPRHLVETIAETAWEQEQMEEYIYTLIDGGAPLAGIYPPNEETIQKYKAWRAENG